MAHDDRPELHLNTLARFSKREAPSALVLEEHSHCEVPAGCGGVVMRWRDPRVGIYLFLEIAATRPLTAHALVDGEPLMSARTGLPFGEHVLDLEVTLEHDEPTHLWVSAVLDVGRALGRAPVLRSLCSSGDGAWRAGRADADADDVRDDAMTPLGADDTIEPDESTRWRVDMLRQRGAEALALPRGPGAFIVRRRFSVTAADAAPDDDDRAGGAP